MHRRNPRHLWQLAMWAGVAVGLLVLPFPGARELRGAGSAPQGRPNVIPSHESPTVQGAPADFQRLPAVPSVEASGAARGSDPPGWFQAPAAGQWPALVQPASYVSQPLAAPPVDLTPPPIDYAEPGVEFYTLEELRSEMREQAWRKGDYKIVPYGVLWGSAIYSSERAAPGPFILYVLSATDEGEDDFVIDTRRSRVGLNIEGPDIPLFQCASSAAQLEVDFHGVLGTVEGSTARGPENQSGVQLRHAFAEIKNDDFRLMAGQTWDLVSPLYPGMLTYAVGWGGGNIGFRRMQIRYERYLHMASGAVWTLQGAVAQDIALDFINYAESANWPVLQGRTAWTSRELGPGGPLTVGVSAHIGEQGFDFPAAGGLPAEDDARIETWSLNADARWPITPRLGVQGEFFTGENLSTLLGGVVQGINRLTREPIPATGGWLDLWYDWTPRLHSHVGFGIDDPKDAYVPPAGRTRNSFVFGNVTFDVTSKLILGLEISHWKTLYADRLPGDSMVVEFTGYYGF